MVLFSIPLNKLPCSFLRSKTKFIVRPPHPQKNHQRIQKEKIQTTFWKNIASTKRAILPVVWTLQARLVAVPKTLTIIVALWFRLDTTESENEKSREKKSSHYYNGTQCSNILAVHIFSETIKMKWNIVEFLTYTYTNTYRTMVYKY